MTDTTNQTAHLPLEARAGKVARPMRPSGDMWRVDVAGYPCSVRGEAAKDHLECVNRQLARMKLALHQIKALGDVDCDAAPDIAGKALS